MSTPAQFERVRTRALDVIRSAAPNHEVGVVTCADARTGEPVWRHRLGGVFFASPVGGDGKVYISSEKGQVFVLPPGPKLEPIAVNDLGDGIYATPALVDGRIYLRTVNTLYCFGLE